MSNKRASRTSVHDFVPRPDFQQPERGKCVYYATMKGSDMSETNDPDYRWRPATKGDIGSVARFGDTDSKHEPWSYGILKAVVKDEMYGWQFTCEANVHLDEDEQFMHCQVQYDANKES